MPQFPLHHSRAVPTRCVAGEGLTPTPPVTPRVLPRLPPPGVPAATPGPPAGAAHTPHSTGGWGADRGTDGQTGGGCSTDGRGMSGTEGRKCDARMVTGMRTDGHRGGKKGEGPAPEPDGAHPDGETEAQLSPPSPAPEEPHVGCPLPRTLRLGAGLGTPTGITSPQPPPRVPQHPPIPTHTPPSRGAQTGPSAPHVPVR